MNLSAVIKMGHELMTQHNLIEKGWSFQLDNSVRRFGVCRYYPRIISISAKLANLNTEIEVRDVILHEIAHAIAGHSAGHGPLWQQVCIRIGAKPERCYKSEEVATPKLRYQAICSGCNTVFERAKKPDDRRRSCKCQNHLSWDKKAILKFKDTFLVIN